ncbi:MAG TPA: carboxypeptidase-like regulatory domain-containing protein, partial [Thermoanaerobaculia bacterium]
MIRTRFRSTLASRALLVLGLWLAALPLLAGAAHAESPVTSQAVAFGVSEELRNLEPSEEKPTEEPEEVKVVPLRIFRTELPDAAPTQDPVLQESVASALTPTPSLFFGALTSDDNATAFGFRVMPPDTVGDVGPNHYVQMVNNLFRVFDKSGNPLTPKLTLGNLFATISGACANRNDGDPIVLYDPLADRWLLSQFCTVANPNNHQLIAISKTSDPAGAYYLYDFLMPNNKFNDYPKFGVWSDAYYMTDNQFNQAGTAFLGAGAFAFDRAKMLAGDPTAGYVYFDIENGNTSIGGVLPSDLDGLNPPPAGTPNYFAYFTAGEFADPAHPFDSLRIFEFRPNFANPAASTFTERADSPLLVAAFDPRSVSGRDDIEQPPPATSSAYLDAIMDRLMFRLAYRNFGTHESLVVTHTVNVSGLTPTTPASLRAGIRYYELRRNLPGGSFTVNEQATFAPNDGLERWMGSAAMDGSGNLAVGYSASSLTSAPSMRYAGRLATDPPGGLFQGETVMIAGTGVQTATQSRWGDYSALSVDPEDDCTFWFTSEYYTAASATNSFGWVTGIGRFTFPTCTPIATGTIQGAVINAATSAPIPGATVVTTNGFSRTSDLTGSYSMKVPAGTYNMMASAPGYSTAVATGVTVSTGGTTVQNFALSPMPILMAAPGAAIGGETCSPSNGAIDPGEAVTVSLPVKNTGTAATVNLVGTLLSGGGVTSPGPAQTYGVVPIGGTGSKSFTFVAAGTCGG